MLIANCECYLGYGVYTLWLLWWDVLKVLWCDVLLKVLWCDVLEVLWYELYYNVLKVLWCTRSTMMH